jgi:hypothetical protein
MGERHGENSHVPRKIDGMNPERMTTRNKALTMMPAVAIHPARLPGDESPAAVRRQHTNETRSAAVVTAVKTMWTTTIQVTVEIPTRRSLWDAGEHAISSTP